jgi:hypothetical protein
MDYRQLPWKIILPIAGVVLVASALSAGGGYWYGKNQGVKEGAAKATITDTTYIKSSPLFLGQSGLIMGRITSIENGKATVEDLKNRFDRFSITPQPVMSKQLTSGVGVFEPVTGDVQIGKFADITLEVKNNEYVITKLIYWPDTVNNFVPEKEASKSSTRSPKPFQQQQIPLPTPSPTPKP